jgi:Icc-related predicted phosphoesterase
MDKYHPKYFLHGHVHANYGKGFKRKDVYGTTRVINGYEFYVIEYPGEPVESAEKRI